MKRLLITAAAIALLSTAASAAELDCTTTANTLHCTVKRPSSEVRMFEVANDNIGYMNIRSGPGRKHKLVGTIPSAELVGASRCAPRDDGIVGPDWCLIDWSGIRGWVSLAGLIPQGAGQ